ncbi:hypothetical protein OHA91_22905 [Streptomyces erythrochromogenes]|uniref:Uncharacterized protein n=1 Tax=Streptomyces erythrochromogenes TaxID=285574 RepID=A0ABZ1QEL3_9ACTN|nr:hypothetical protein [Streptomyces erythrochromogenes]
MSGISSTSMAVLTAAIEDYRVLTPPDEATPAGLATAIGEYLASSGLTICPDTDA